MSWIEAGSRFGRWTIASVAMDMTTARPTLKWLDYAWLNKKQRILSGFLRDRHSLMKEWLHERWKGLLAFLLENISQTAA